MSVRHRNVVSSNDESPGSPFDRRKLLAGMATGTLGLVAVPGVRGLAGPAAAAASTGNGQRPGATGLSARLAKDGLLVGSVAGTYIGTDGDAVLIGVDAAIAVVRVRITRDTRVSAAGVIVNGDVSRCKTGDRANVGTIFDDKGQRVAEYLYTNGMAYWGDVAAVDARSLTVTPYWAGKEWADVRMLTIPETTVYPLDGSGAKHGVGAAAAVLRRGDENIHVTCLADSPGPNPGKMWAVTIHQ
jgi:hypothetical protein